MLKNLEEKSEKNFLLPWSYYFKSLLKSFQWHVKEKTAVTNQEDKINLLYHNFSSLDVLTTLLTH